MKAERLASLIKNTALLLALFLLQTGVFSRVRLMGAAPLLLPLFAVGAGLFNGGLHGGLWGLAAGVLCDASMGGTGLLFTVLLTVCGFFAGFLSQFILARGFPSFCVMSVAVLVISALLQLFRFLAFYGADPLSLLLTGLRQTLYSFIFILPVYLCVRRASRPRIKGR